MRLSGRLGPLGVSFSVTRVPLIHGIVDTIGMLVQRNGTLLHCMRPLVSCWVMTTRVTGIRTGGI